MKMCGEDSRQRGEEEGNAESRFGKMTDKLKKMKLL
jgi:hypothetical protein